MHHFQTVSDNLLSTGRLFSRALLSVAYASSWGSHTSVFRDVAGYHMMRLSVVRFNRRGALASGKKI